MDHIGDFSPSHNGIDFNVNESSVVLCPHDAYVSDIRFYENEYGNHWQTNVRIRLNSQWYITMKFESWAEDQYNGTLQRNNVSVSVGDKILANQTMGNLLSHGPHSHLHYDVDRSGTYVCPYSYFSPDAQDKFDPIYDRCGESSTPCH
ncbi:MAG: peptidoglycan DD-metalloendopeptidase family protein [Candidatus Lokiarchaeota archaeon]|nr:peptidoglycan DD-metalloendopeptidase family protein [Candidatus Lokiarchaeota archaeon]MBD3342880.1 peptidoglycan DD-metalloendopeptidase family protein [Candidatus Lokiarchaeota archaeon]